MDVFTKLFGDFPRAAVAKPDGAADAYSVYFIFKSTEQGPTYRVSLPR